MTAFKSGLLAAWLSACASCCAWAQTTAGMSTPRVDKQARAWAATCSSCHGPGGRSVGAIPPIAGRDAAETLRILLEFKNDQLPAATLMPQHAKGYTDEELRRIAQYLSTLPAR